ncbi:NACHT domain-containing protein [Streptomyces sp. SID13726]|uniref:NACHT domain-containing protein n=1 Tax=Streptomyces sp. SID13726 TaxID=2706058 RepID=UPI0013B95F3E|nr:NACHT domain-containing protein [Streptomyces sp. SID13726]NEB05750.1 NACHT domain-containing protein [Streptomyces sp. SID13726]
MVQVLVAHAQGEEDLAEKVGAPLALAGYEVLHYGTLLVGESLSDKASQAIAQGSPLVLCGTVRAAGTPWARRLVNAARHHPGVRIFALQMEQDADLETLTLDGKVALYWQDPARAIAALVDALSAYYPVDGSDEPTGGRASDDLESRYRDLALSTCDIVHLAYLPIEDRELATKELLLRSLYVSLRVGVQIALGSAAHELDKTLQDMEGQRGGIGNTTDSESRFSIGRRLEQSKRLVVLGDPGAGKSTMLRWIATAYLLRLKADPDWRELPDVDTLPDADWLPLLIRCREIDEGQGLGSLEDIVRRQLRHDAQSRFSEAETTSLAEVLLDALQDGRVLLLIDGLDEIADPGLRARFCSQIEQIHVAHPQASIVVTSRIVGYKEMGLAIGRGFEHVTVLDLTPEDKDDFAQRWCEVAEPLAGREEARRQLVSDIHSSDRIERLTGNPMLLTTMALVKKKVGKLPSHRADLYREAVDVLLSWRSSASERIDRYEALPQLQYLAYSMCDAGVQQMREDQVLDTLERMREEFPVVRAAHNHSPLEFLRLLESRTGILVESGHARHHGELVPVYEFRHLTFQEYLAGLALVTGRFPGKERGRPLADQVAVLAARTSPDPHSFSNPAAAESWHEALRLCVMSCNDDDVDSVLLAIALPLGDEPEETGAVRATLAVACLSDEPNVSEGAALQIIDRFVEASDDDRYSNRDSPSAEMLASIWGPVLIRRLIAAWLEKPSDFWRLGGVISSALGHGIPKSSHEVEVWVGQQTRRLAEPDACTSIEAALALMEAGFQGTIVLVPDLIPRLTAMLSLGLCESTSAAWALCWLSKGTSVYAQQRTWEPTTQQLHELTRIIKTGELSAEAVAYLLLCFDDSSKAAHHAMGPSVIKHFEASTSKGRELLSQEYARLFPQESAPVIPFIRHRDPEVRRAAVLLLSALETSQAADTLLDILPDTKEPELYESIARSLGRFGDSRAVKPLLNLKKELTLEPPSVVIAALSALGDQRSARAATQALRSVDSEERARALWSLASVERDKVTRVLLSRDRYDNRPGRDPQQKITEKDLAAYSKAVQLPLEEVRTRYEDLATRYSLKLAWIPTQR